MPEFQRWKPLGYTQAELLVCTSATTVPSTSQRGGQRRDPAIGLTAPDDLLEVFGFSGFAEFDFRQPCAVSTCS